MSMAIAYLAERKKEEERQVIAELIVAYR